jgi:cytochrome c-type biogenesis protein CcmH
MLRKLPLILAAVTASLFATVMVVKAQERIPTDDEVNAIAKKLYCPVCPNTPLDVCETKACEDWRAQIRDELAAGWSEQQILDYFVAQYGERVLAEPERKGFTSLVWVLPVIAVLLGMVTVWQVLRGWQTGSPPAHASAPVSNISPETMAQIEKELEEVE